MISSYFSCKASMVYSTKEYLKLGNDLAVYFKTKKRGTNGINLGLELLLTVLLIYILCVIV